MNDDARYEAILAYLRDEITTDELLKHYEDREEHECNQ